MSAPPEAASRYYAASTLLAERAAAEAVRVRPRGVRFAWEILATNQVRQARVAVEAVAVMLAEQDIAREAEALLNSAAFTTSQSMFEQMVQDVETDAEFARIVASLTQDAGRAAESVSVATRDRIAHVRYLNPPSCSRCAVLGGRIYRWSSGFARHPGCDCVMIPTTVANDQLVQDPVELMQQGLVTGMSKADRRAIADGADFNQVVNIRSRAAGLQEAGRVLARPDRLTPEGIYRAAGDDRAQAMTLLAANGYLL